METCPASVDTSRAQELLKFLGPLSVEIFYLANNFHIPSGYDLCMKVVVQNNFAIGQTHLGTAVFAARAFKVGDVITQFKGTVIPKSRIPKKYEGAADRYVQIGLNSFLGPSGEVDDLINHSCDPNSGLKFTTSGILLVAIKDIEVGEEIAWDYSTTMLENDWKMRCDCRTTKCRKIIGDFMLLDSKTQRKYLELGIVPGYIQDFVKSPEYKVYTEAIRQLSTHGRKKK